MTARAKQGVETATNGALVRLLADMVEAALARDSECRPAGVQSTTKAQHRNGAAA